MGVIISRIKQRNVFVVPYDVLHAVACMKHAPVIACFKNTHVTGFNTPLILSTSLSFTLSSLYYSEMFVILLRNTLKYFPCFGLFIMSDQIFQLDSVKCLHPLAKKNL